MHQHPSPSPHPTSPLLTAEWGVPHQLHSHIIGPHGNTIKGIKQKFSELTISIPRAEENKDSIIVRCPEKQLEAIKHELQEILGGFQLGPAPLATAHMTIPSGSVGIVVGKGGGTIKQLQQQNGTYIHVESNGQVFVSGTQVAVETTHKALESLLSTKIHITIDGPSAKLNLKPTLINLDQVKTEALFFPHDGERKYLRFLEYIASAKKTMDVCMFTITCDRVARALVNACLQGVVVRVICDDEKVADAGSDIMTLVKAGIEVRTDNTTAFMHHKFAILDGKVLLNGSFNWTKQAHEANRENILITSDPVAVASFATEFNAIWAEFSASQLH